MLALKSVKEVQLELSKRFQEIRLTNNLSQKSLSEKSGVSYSSIRRFERLGEISLKSLLKLAQILNALNEFEQLFPRSEFTSLDEIRKSSSSKRKRGQK